MCCPKLLTVLYPIVALMAVKDINDHEAILPKHDIILDILGRGRRHSRYSRRTADVQQTYSRHTADTPDTPDTEDTANIQQIQQTYSR